MPAASGSLAFLGAARFQGYWDAEGNNATGSGLAGGVTGPVSALFRTGDSTNAGGYADATGLTASIGDYWQVTGSGTHNVDGNTSWALNDWCIYSGSAGASGNWIKLAFDDTIASIVMGDLAGSTVFNLTGSSDKQILFITGASDADVVQSGSDNFVFDYTTNRVGIGTDSPSHNLHVKPSSGNARFVLESDDNSSDVELRLDCASSTRNAYISFRNADTMVGGVGYVASDSLTKIWGHNNPNDDHLCITSAGNVGIATNSPQHKMTVAGTLGTSGDLTVSGTAHFAHLTASSISSSFYGDTAFVNNVMGPTDGTLTIKSDESIAIELDKDNTSSGMFRVFDGSGDVIFSISGGTGDVIIPKDLTINGANLTFGSTGGAPEIAVADYIAGQPGVDLKVTAGAAAPGSGTANRPGGDLILSAGASTGTNTSTIEFKTSTAGSSGTSANAPAERMRVHTDGNIGIATNSPEHTLSVTGTLGVSSHTTVSGTLYANHLTASSISSSFYGDGTHLTNAGTITALNEQTENRLVTIGSTTTELDGEPNLTFDGSTNLLTVVGNITASTNVSASAFYAQELHATNIDLSTNLSDVLIKDNTIAALQFKEGSNDYLTFSTYNTKERVIFDKDLIIKDDIKLLVGGSSLTHEAEIFYNETGDDFMVISGSAKGIAISGSTIDVDGKVAIGRQSTGTTGLPEHTLSVTGTLGVSSHTTVSGTLYATNVTASTNVSASAFYGDLVAANIQSNGVDPLSITSTSNDILLQSSDEVYILANSNIILDLDNDNDDTSSNFIIKNGTNTPIFIVAESTGLAYAAQLGVGTTGAEHTLSVTGTLGVSGDATISGSSYLKNAIVTPGASGGHGITVTHTDVDKTGIVINTTNTTTGGSLLINHDDDTTAASAQKTMFAVDFDKTGIQAQSTTASFCAQDITMLDAANNHAGGTVHMTGSTIFVSSSYDGGLNTTNTGLRVLTQGADTNYDALFLGGNVGIGDSTPLTKLSVVANAHSSSAVFIRNDGDHDSRFGMFISCGKDNPTSNGDITWLVLADGDSDGFNGLVSRIRYDTGGAGAVLESASDRRVKTDIKPTKVNALEILNNIPLSEFKMAKKNKPIGDLNRIGFVAQDCEKAWPEMVSEMEDSDYDHKIKTIAPSTLIPVLVKAVQELSAEVEALKKK